MDEFLKKMNPETFTLNAFLFIVVVAVIVFVFTRWWPWYEKTYWPAREARRSKEFDAEQVAEQERNSVMRSIRDGQIEITLLVKQALSEVRDHDTWTRSYVQAGAEHATQDRVANILAQAKKQ